MCEALEYKRRTNGEIDLTMMKLKATRPLYTLLILALLGAIALPTRAMNRVRVLTYTDAAVSELGVTGRGVVVGILDRGIDWDNADFRNEDGTTRIAAILDLGDDTGAHDVDNPYGVGTMYTREEIDSALTNGTQLATRDALGHGTTTAGIITGNGRNLPDRCYRGIAPEATIVIAKVTGGAPAHGDQPEEPAFYTADRLPVAIDFIRDTADGLGMPCVMLLNLGSQGGPTDGTSALCRKIDDTVGPGKPGIAFVTGPGDEGGSDNRAAGTVTEGDTAALQIEKHDPGALVCDIWYSSADRFDVSVEGPSGTSGPFAPPSTESARTEAHGADFDLYHNGADVDFYGADNGKRELTVYLGASAVGTYTINLTGTSISNGHFDAVLAPTTYGTGPSENRFLTYLAPGSIWDGATAENNICPGDYVFRTRWTDVDGFDRSTTGGGEPGELWRGSSTGPTFDGRLGIDVCAPGNTLFTTYNPDSYFATFRFNLVDDGEGFYGAASAVSAAAPTVTGIIALMLEANPMLDASEIREILHRSARRDEFTGAVPNPQWGYGKVDAFGAVALAVPGTPPVLDKVNVKVAASKIKIIGSDFGSAPTVYIDGIPFASPPKIKKGTKLIQKGKLANGMTLDEYLRPGEQASIVVRAEAGGAAEDFYSR